MLAVAGVVAALAVPCDLSLRYGARAGHGAEQSSVALVIVNRGSTSCRVSGYPEVELIGPPVPKWLGSVYTVRRAAGRTRTVDLRPGAAARAVLTWLPWGPGNPRFTPAYVHVVVETAGGRSLPLALAWRFGPVLRQDAATHPGTFIGPLGRA